MRLYERFADKGYHTSIATTFGIDFDAYENIVLPRIRGAGCRNNMVLSDARMLTHALDGASALPRNAGKLYTAAGASTKGLFHPKLFLQVGRKGGRLIIGSANLTAAGLAGNLELVTQLTCDTEDDGAQRLIALAWQYLSSLIDPAHPMLPIQQEWMLNRAAWLRSAKPAEGLVTLADRSQVALLIAGGHAGIGARFADMINEPIKRLIVISPYWDEQLAALAHLNERLAPNEIALLIDPETEVFPRDAVASIPNLKLYRREGFENGRFIHAKALIAETGNADHLVIGSANCTVAALGTRSSAGSNDEACLYRELPPGAAINRLGLENLLRDEKRIDADDLEPLRIEDDISLDTLATRHPGTFSLRGDTLTWHPAPHITVPNDYAIALLSSSGASLEITPSRLESSDVSAIRYQINITDEAPNFAQVVGAQKFPPAIITLIDVLQAAIRETHSRTTENALAQLDGETEPTLALMEVFDLLERIEDSAPDTSCEGVSIPKARTQTDHSPSQEHRNLNYEEFVAGRRPHQFGPILHNSFGSSDVSIVRGFLNRIVGLNTLTAENDEGDDEVIKDAFDLGDETDNAEAALAAGEEPEVQPKTRVSPEPDEDERRRNAMQRNATKDQLVNAATNFTKRINLKQQGGALLPRDFLLLRALLMIICAASWKGTNKAKDKEKGRTALQVLPVEGDTDSWPFVIGRLLFKVFGGPNPAIKSLEVKGDHDQIPADLIECWATCIWCLQACLAAPILTKGERIKIDRYIKPLTAHTYRRTLLSNDELHSESVIDVMTRMDVKYAGRLGVEPDAMHRAHEALCREIFDEHGDGVAGYQDGAANA